MVSKLIRPPHLLLSSWAYRPHSWGRVDNKMQNIICFHGCGRCPASSCALACRKETTAKRKRKGKEEWSTKEKRRRMMQEDERENCTEETVDTLVTFQLMSLLMSFILCLMPATCLFCFVLLKLG